MCSENELVNEIMVLLNNIDYLNNDLVSYIILKLINTKLKINFENFI